MSTDADTTQAQALASMRRARTTIREADRTIGYEVGAARNAGATWEQIGEALAITKQAAQQRYGRTFPEKLLGVKEPR